MAAYVRSLDPNHMITVGSEGFYGASTPELLSNNPGPWGVEMGQDFVTNTNIPQIDFATVHAWPDNWMIPQEKTAAFLDKWVQSHINVSTKALKTKKPVLFEEFGKKLQSNEQTAEGIRQLRDPIYASTYDSVEKAIGMGQPIAGSLFWKWAIPVFNRQDPRGPYGVLPTDTTMAYVKEHSQFMKRKLNSVPPVGGAARRARGGALAGALWEGPGGGRGHAAACGGRCPCHPALAPDPAPPCLHPPFPPQEPQVRPRRLVRCLQHRHPGALLREPRQGRRRVLRAQQWHDRGRGHVQRGGPEAGAGAARQEHSGVPHRGRLLQAGHRRARAGLHQGGGQGQELSGAGVTGRPGGVTARAAPRPEAAARRRRPPAGAYLCRRLLVP
jgi:hypothetical protein